MEIELLINDNEKRVSETLKEVIIKKAHALEDSMDSNYEINFVRIEVTNIVEVCYYADFGTCLQIDSYNSMVELIND